MSIFDSMVKTTGNELAQAADKGTTGDVHDYIDSGSYSLNALLSGSIYKGYAVGKVTCLAGDPAAGKTYALLTACKNFLDTHKGSAVFYYESESAITKDDLISRGIDVKRFYVIPVVTVQEFRTQTLKVLDAYSKVPVAERPKMLMCLDSLGMLSTTKEMDDSLEGSETKDMTRSQIIKAAFRTITLGLGKANVAMIITMHTYATMDQYNPKEVSGGSGPKFAASSIIMLNKRKEKDGTEVIGNNIRAVAIKSRFTKEFSEVVTMIRYETGIDRYYGLLDLAEVTGVFTKDSTRYVIPDGTKTFGKTIINNPEKYFTPEVLKLIDERVPNVLCYGSGSSETIEEVTGENQ